MALIDVVKYDAEESVLVRKFPSEDLSLGSQLIVGVGQTAFFAKGGEIFDQYPSGTHTLKSENIPLLNKVINLPFGGQTPFQAEVWFVNLLSKLDNKWGTPLPIQLEDPKYHVIVPIRAFGQFGLSVADPRLFLERLSGNLRSFSADKVVEYFKGKISSSFASSISRKISDDNISVLQIHTSLDELSEYCSERMRGYFAEYGLNLESFFISSVNLPEDDPSVIKLKEAKDLAARVAIAGRDMYHAERGYDVLEKAAENEATLGGTMGAGIGLGVGMGLGNQMAGMAGGMGTSNAGTSESPPPPPTPNPHQYFVLVNSNQHGPYEPAAIKQMLLQGQLTTETLAWRQGLSQWVPIASINDLVAAPPPPPPQN